MDQERKTQGRGTMEMCPMAPMCKRMAQKPGFGFLLLMPGFLLVLGGVLIFIEPRILVWLMASASILIGVVMVFLATISHLVYGLGLGIVLNIVSQHWSV